MIIEFAESSIQDFPTVLWILWRQLLLIKLLRVVAKTNVVFTWTFSETWLTYYDLVRHLHFRHKGIVLFGWHAWRPGRLLLNRRWSRQYFYETLQFKWLLCIPHYFWFDPVQHVKEILASIRLVEHIVIQFRSNFIVVVIWLSNSEGTREMLCMVCERTEFQKLQQTSASCGSFHRLVTFIWCLVCKGIVRIHNCQLVHLSVALQLLILCLS